MKLDADVLLQCVAQIEEKIRGGAMLATAMNEVLKDHTEPMCADDVLFTHDTVRNILDQHGYKTGRIIKQDVLALGNMRRKKGQKTQRQEVAFDRTSRPSTARREVRDWLSETEERHEAIHSEFEADQQKAG